MSAHCYRCSIRNVEPYLTFNVYHFRHAGYPYQLFWSTLRFKARLRSYYNNLHLFPLKTSEIRKGSCERGVSLKFGTDERDRRDKHVAAMSTTSDSGRWSASTNSGITRAHQHAQIFAFFPTAPDASVGNAPPPPGPFSQALTRALVPHLSDTSGTMRYPCRRRRRFYEPLGTQLLVLIGASPLRR